MIYATTDIGVAAFLVTKYGTSPDIEWDEGSRKASFLIPHTSEDVNADIKSYYQGMELSAFGFFQALSLLKSLLHSSNNKDRGIYDRRHNGNK